MKKLICFALSLVMLLGTMVLVSCSKEDEKQNNAQGDSTENNYLTGFDFQGDVIRFALAHAEQGNYSSYGWIGCDVDEVNGDSVVDAVYHRNALVEERLNVEIQVAFTTPDSNLTKTILTSLQSGENDYDILWGWTAGDFSLATKGMLYDIAKLDESVNHLDPEADWWAGDYMKHYQYKDEIYWMSGPLSFMYAGGASCTYVNTRLYDAHFANEYGNIYDFVRQGKWTVDEFAKMSATVYQDLDSDEKYSDGDLVGVRFASSWDIMNLLIACGLETCSRSADGTINFEVTTANNEYITRVTKVYNLFDSTPGLTTQKSWKSRDLFIDGSQLFAFGQLDTMLGIREMSDDFYLIPSPKLDINQPEYRSAMVDWAQPMGLAYTIPEERLSAVTATLELMAYCSAQTVYPAYFEEALKYKYSRDDDTAEMVQLIHDSVYTDFGIIWEESIFGDLWIRYKGFTSGVTSEIRKKTESWTANFNAIKESFETAAGA